MFSKLALRDILTCGASVAPSAGLHAGLRLGYGHWPASSGSTGRAMSRRRRSVGARQITATSSGPTLGIAEQVWKLSISSHPGENWGRDGASDWALEQTETPSWPSRISHTTGLQSLTGRPGRKTGSEDLATACQSARSGPGTLDGPTPLPA